MRTGKAARGSRREKRTRSNPHRDGARRGGAFTISPLGGQFHPEALERILAAIGRFEPDANWKDVAPNVMPLLKRRSHPYPAEVAPFHMNVPPGIWAGFGIDMGPAFTHVSAALIERWGIDQATLLGTALENLRRIARDEPPVVDQIRPEGVDATVVQAQGWGSALVLAPDRLGAILGPRPRVLLTPVRNTLIALPDDVDFDLAFDLWQAVAEGCHDELDVDPMRWTGSSVVMLSAGGTGRPN